MHIFSCNGARHAFMLKGACSILDSPSDARVMRGSVAASSAFSGADHSSLDEVCRVTLMTRGSPEPMPQRTRSGQACRKLQSGYNHSDCIDEQVPTMSDLTPRQTQILRLVQRFISETGMPPTRAEIARELGFRSANAAEEHLRALARKGVIALVPGHLAGYPAQGHHPRADGSAAHRPGRRR